MNKKFTFILGLALAIPQAVSAIDYKLVGAGVVGLGGMTASAYHYLTHCRAIKKQEHQLDQKNRMQLVNGPLIEIYNWDTANYPTARAVRAAERVCVDRLVADAMTGKIRGINPNKYTGSNNPVHWDNYKGMRINGPLHRDVVCAIESLIEVEIAHLQSYLNGLKPYVSPYGDIDQDSHKWLSGNMFGIDYCAKLARACKRYNANANDPSTWTLAQEQSIENYMKNCAVTSITKFIRGNVHYGIAARLYWDTFKKLCRLDALKQAFIKDRLYLR